MNPKYLSMLQIVICAFLWSTGGIFIKLIPWHAFVLSGTRSLFAALMVLIYIKIAKIKLEINKQTLSIAGCLCLTFLAFVLANKMTTAANAIILQYIAPVLILIYLAVFKKKRFVARDYVVVACTVLGIFLFVMDGISAGNLLGNIVGIIGGITFAGVFITSSGVSESTRFSGIFQGQLLTAIVGMPFMAVYETSFDMQSIILVILLGLFQLGLPYALYAVALKTCPPLTASLIAVLEPLLNPLWVFLATGELPGTWSLVGGAIVLISVTVWCAKDAMVKKT